jgi:tRNA dimethylallyltransferase
MIYVIGGPTGSGKTSLAIQLAKQWQAPIVNADAFQTYQGMNIGTNKDLHQFQNLTTYMFDTVTPAEGMTVARYQQTVRPLLTTLLKQHARVIMVGGTGLYIKATLYDFAFLPMKPTVDMAKYETWSNEELHAYLAKLDGLTSTKIHPHNRRRVLRAIAICLTTGEKKSEQEAKQTKQLLYPATFIGLKVDRLHLYARVIARVDAMFNQGLVDEVRQLVTQYGNNCQAFQAIGYKEVIGYFTQRYDLATTKTMIKQATTRYVKRQLTYFRHQFPMQWYGSDVEAMASL